MKDQERDIELLNNEIFNMVADITIGKNLFNHYSRLITIIEDLNGRIELELAAGNDKGAIIFRELCYCYYRLKDDVQKAYYEKRKGQSPKDTDRPDRANN